VIPGRSGKGRWCPTVAAGSRCLPGSSENGAAGSIGPAPNAHNGPRLSVTGHMPLLATHCLVQGSPH